VTVSGLTNSDGAISATIGAGCEATDGARDGHTRPDGAGIGTFTARLRAERSFWGNGRVYTIYFTASDAKGGSCQGSVVVCAPTFRNGTCENDFDSTVCATSFK
jgi:hypothetical protein